MNKIKLSLFVLIASTMFIACSGSSDGDGVGKFAVKKIETSAERNMVKAQSNQKSTMSKSIINMDGGEINSAVTQYFILQNVGTENITDIKMYIMQAKDGVTVSSDASNEFFVSGGAINSANFQENANFSIRPNVLTVIAPTSNASTIQLISILISDGENQNGVGYDKLVLNEDVNDSIYIVITGMSNGEYLQLNINFSMIINYINFDVTMYGQTEPLPKGSPNDSVVNYISFYYDCKFTLKNTGTIEFKFYLYGGNWIINDFEGSTIDVPENTNILIRGASDRSVYIVLQPGESIKINSKATSEVGYVYSNGYIFDESLITFEAFVTNNFNLDLKISI